MHDTKANRKFRSQEWFDNPNNPGMTAIYLERHLNHGFTREELQSESPIIGIANTGSDLAPCNKIHVFLMDRIKAGIRTAGGIPMEFPVHPIQETVKRPTAALDRNLTYLSLVEVLHGYPIDGVVLTTGCDKTTPALLMGAATMDLPAIALNGGPMLDGWWKGKRAGSGMDRLGKPPFAGGRQNRLRRIHRANLFLSAVARTLQYNGTASTMNAMAEALGMTLPGSAAIPAPFQERMSMAYAAGKRIVGMVEEDLKPSDILTRTAFENAIRVNSAIGGSNECASPLASDCAARGRSFGRNGLAEVRIRNPVARQHAASGEFLGESFFRAGGVPAVVGELLDAGLLDGSPITASGKSMFEIYRRRSQPGPERH